MSELISISSNLYTYYNQLIINKVFFPLSVRNIKIKLKNDENLLTINNYHGHVSKYVHCIPDIDHNKYVSKINDYCVSFFFYYYILFYVW